MVYSFQSYHFFALFAYSTNTTNDICSMEWVVDNIFWIYHSGNLPNYWARVASKHFTAFSRQVSEGFLIGEAGTHLDIVMNSKAEILGTRLTRKKVHIKGRMVVAG